ncbi:MAG: Ig-like domain-containing protein [Clostridia bacterium]|nr:Ig-like domain-containing protein [Clostridia bacterium]
MGKSKNSSDVKLNRRLRWTAIIFVISAAIALAVILNKGVIFGKRLVAISESVNSASEQVHVIQIVATNNYLKNVGDTVELKLSIDGQDVANGEGYELISSDEEVIKLDGDIATAVALGDAVITARSTEYNVEGTVTLSVVVPASKLTLSAEFPSIGVGETDQISHTTRPTEASGVQVKLTYQSSDNSIATVDNSGIVTGIAPGTVTITGTDKITGLSDIYDITIK